MKTWTVWVGGVEVVDHLVTCDEANDIAAYWREQGYDDVAVDSYEVTA